MDARSNPISLVDPNRGYVGRGALPSVCSSATRPVQPCCPSNFKDPSVWCNLLVSLKTWPQYVYNGAAGVIARVRSCLPDIGGAAVSLPLSLPPSLPSLSLNVLHSLTLSAHA